VVSKDHLERFGLFSLALSILFYISQSLNYKPKYLTCFILTELKVGLSEKTILNFFHENAMDLFNVTSNLRTVCEELKNPSFKMDSADVFSPFFSPLVFIFIHSFM
jgi:hypothetical protein